MAVIGFNHRLRAFWFAPAFVATLFCSGLVAAQTASAPRPVLKSSTALTRKKVLVLNSYRAGFAWTDDIVRGIQSVLTSQPYEVEFWFEHMDSARHPGARYTEELARLYGLKYQRTRFDVIISSDDEALDFLLSRRAELFGGTPVVFSGVNNLERAGEAPRDAVTGVLEVFSISQMIDMARKLHPGTRRVYVVSDPLPSSVAQRQALEQIARRSADLEFTFLDGRFLSLARIEDELRTTSFGSIVIATNFKLDRDGLYYPGQEAVLRLARACQAPIYSPSVNQAGQGIVAGSRNGGYRHGVLAARQAARILAGETPSQIPIETDDYNEFEFDHAQLTKWNIDESLLPKNAVVLNRPKSFYKTNKSVIWAGGGFMVFQSIVIASLILNARRRKRAEFLFHRHSQAIEQLTSGVAIVGKDGNLEYVNHAFATMHGFAREELIGKPLATVGVTGRALAGWGRHDRAQASIVEHRRGDGSLILCRTSASLMRDDAGDVSGVIVIADDVTEERRLEEELRHMQKMEAIGHLAGGIAHDFNNLLTVITGFCELSVNRIESEHPVRSHLIEIQKAGRFAATLTRQLLAFSRRQIVEPARVNLNSVVADLLKMMRRLIASDIEVVVDLDPELDCVMADDGQLQQVVLNLALNAKDAMPLGGTLTIRTAHVDVPQQDASALGIAPGGYVELTVGDTGLGMDRETVARAFEPFFTTKELGFGTGLGLSTVYGIVRQAGGGVSVQSETGKGTTFRILLRRVEGEEEIEPLPCPGGPLVGYETILVVEDRDDVRHFASLALRGWGYRVLEAADGQEAIGIAEQHAGPLHVVLTDVVMPGLSGPETAARLQQLHPEARILYMSGYPNRLAPLQKRAEGGARFIAKPFTPSELAAQVREVLCSN
ncbi:MAG: ABC transporter substrate binding protein [Bryobacteraceae bacterium]